MINQIMQLVIPYIFSAIVKKAGEQTNAENENFLYQACWEISKGMVKAFLVIKHNQKPV